MEASAHWKFISRNNMSLNCKIGIERERVCTVINRPGSSKKSSRCVRKNKHCRTGTFDVFWTNWHRSPVDPFDVIESLALITGL